MSKPKRHHYLPQFYLNLFCRDGGLWVFDRERKQFRQQTPKNTALKHHYYTAENAEGQPDTRIEEFLSIVEGRAKMVLDKLTSKQRISADEKAEFSLFVALMMNRVPDFEKSVNEMHEFMIRRVGDLMFANEERVQATMDSHERDTGEKPKVSAKDLVDFYKSGEFDIAIHRNASLELMLSLADDLAKYFRQMNWGVFHATPMTSFITTDNPFLLIPPDERGPSIYGAGIITPGARKVFPLSPECCLVMFDHGNDLFHRSLDKRTVRGTNLRLAVHSDRFVIARDEAQLRHVVSHSKIEEREPFRRFSFG